MPEEESFQALRAGRQRVGTPPASGGAGAAVGPQLWGKQGVGGRTRHGGLMVGLPRRARGTSCVAADEARWGGVAAAARRARPGGQRTCVAAERRSGPRPPPPPAALPGGAGGGMCWGLLPPAGGPAGPPAPQGRPPAEPGRAAPQPPASRRGVTGSSWVRDRSVVGSRAGLWCGTTVEGEGRARCLGSEGGGGNDARAGAGLLAGSHRAARSRWGSAVCPLL